MSTRTKKPNISDESLRKIEEYETTQRLYNEYDSYIRESKTTTQRAKDKLAKEIGETGDEFIEDLETADKLYKEYSDKVEYIIKNSGDKYGSLEKLNAMTYQQVDSIYDRVQEESKKGFWTKLFDFLMGW